MRGKLSDQDLTNYALNELDARERLYVESMLAVSVECRDDVYQMIDVAQMLEEGFERETIKLTATLTPEQRQRLVLPKQRNRVLEFVHKAAATVALAACVAFALVSPQLLKHEQGVGSVAKMQNQMTGIVSSVATVVSPNKEKVDISSLVNLQTLADDSSSWIQAASEALPQPPAVVCTPPSWLDSSDLPELR